MTLAGQLFFSLFFLCWFLFSGFANRLRETADCGPRDAKSMRRVSAVLSFKRTSISIRTSTPLLLLLLLPTLIFSSRFL